MWPNALRKSLFIILGLCLVVGAAWFVARAVQTSRAEVELKNAVEEIIELIDLPPSKSFRETVDAVRVFVNDHSRGKMDATFYAMRNDPVAFAKGLIAHARDPSTERVHMECSTRARLMEGILRQMAVETRTIGIFATNGRFSSHSFLDVFNPQSKQWETVDPDYDLYWIDRSTGNRVSLVEAAEKLDDLQPCGRERCGWDLEGRDGRRPKSLRDKLDILAVTHRGKNLRYAVYTGRANLGRKLSFKGDSGTFCEMFPKRCRDGFFAMGDLAQRQRK